MLVCCGEALIDMVPVKCGEGGEDGFVPRPGGSVFNTAVALGRLGSHPGFVSGLSRDMFGQMLESVLVNSNVDASFCARADRPTPMAYVQLTGGHATYLFYDAESAVRMLGAGDLPELPDRLNALFLGGISLASEPCGETFATLAEREHRKTVVMVDPNIRPAFIENEVRYRRRLDRLFRVADIVKVSEEDLTWLVPGPLTVTERAQGLLERGPVLLLVTSGEKGAVCFVADGRVVKKKIKPSPVVDTIGAGDTFNAGFLHNLKSRGLLQKHRLPNLSDAEIAEALDFGVKVAAVVVSRSGANPPWASELKNAS